MKFVVTGGAGNVSKPLTELLLRRGHEVVVVGRSEENLKSLVAQGAKAAIGDLADVAFLTKTFNGADGVYLLIPPSWNADNIKRVSQELAKGFVDAIRATGVRDVVFLSSYGAHRLDDAGAISGMGLAEVELNRLEGVNVLHLRAGYFYTNLLLSVGLIKSNGIMGNMFTIPEGDFTVVDPYEIAVAAADALSERNFVGHSFRYIVSDETGTDEIAALIGKEIGKPDLKWVKFPPQDLRSALLGYGFAEGAADEYVEMFDALDRGVLFEDYVRHKPRLGRVAIEDFAKRFAQVYFSR